MKPARVAAAPRHAGTSGAQAASQSGNCAASSASELRHGAAVVLGPAREDGGVVVAARPRAPARPARAPRVGERPGFGREIGGALLVHQRQALGRDDPRPQEARLRGRDAARRLRPAAATPARRATGVSSQALHGITVGAVQTVRPAARCARSWRAARWRASRLFGVTTTPPEASAAASGGGSASRGGRTSRGAWCSRGKGGSTTNRRRSRRPV